jgi:hypothetical protein
VVNQYLSAIYGAPCVLTEILQTKEWALIAALNGGETPIKHKVIRNDKMQVSAPIWNSRIYEAGSRTQNYDKGFERFVGKFNPDTPYKAVMAIESGVHLQVVALPRPVTLFLCGGLRS